MRRFLPCAEGKMSKFDLDKYLKELEELVNCESFTHDFESLNKTAEYLAEKYRAAGLYVDVEYQGEEKLAHVVASTVDPKEVEGEEKPYDIMFVGHYDTVFETGTVAKRPFSIDGDMAKGPGVADMKAGDLLAFYLTLELKERYPDARILIVNNGDEEGGSFISGDSLTEISKKAKFAFDMEPGRLNHRFVRTRKGVGEIKIKFKGRPSHAGIAPEKGANAVEEAAHWILALHKLNNPEKGITVNVDVINGGVLANVIAEDCEIIFDDRFLTLEDRDEIEAGVRYLMEHPFNPEVKNEFIKLSEFPPMVMLPETQQMIDVMNEEAEKLGLDIDFVDVAGASDASLVSLAGTPVIDACGPCGDLYHNDGEYLLIHTIEERFNLLLSTCERLMGKK